MSTATLNGAPPATAFNPFAGKAATGGGGNYEVCPAGNYPARLVAIYDLGTHDSEYLGKTKPNVRSLYLAWELTGELQENGQPHVMGRDYTVMVDDDGSFAYGADSNLRKLLEGWRGSKYLPGEPIDIVACMGKPCLVNVTNSTKGEKTYANLDKVSPSIKGMTVLPLIHDRVLFHISMGDPPAVLWLPKLWHRDSEKMLYPEEYACLSKERLGLPIDRKAKPQAADTPYSEQVATPAAAAPEAPAAPVDDDISF